MTLAPNSRFGSYIVTRYLAVGATGEVYRCHDPVNGRDVALKILFPEDGVQDDKTIAQFQEEALIMGSLVHPSIPKLYDSGMENGVYYIASEFLDGKHLQGPIKAPELFAVAVQVAASVTAMHEAGVVHQDLKPENLIMNRDGHLKIIDFGRAQRLTFDMVTDPEKSSWWRRLVRSEQLSFGMLLYELATGIGPFKDRETAPALAGLLGEQLVPLPTENQLSLEEAVRLCAAEDGSDAGLLLTAMSLALCLAGSSTPSLKV